MGGPLSGLRLLDLSQWAVGPFACALLGQMGMDVIRIEAPDATRLTRSPLPLKNGLTTTYNAMQMNKRAASWDLRDEAVRETIFEIVRQSDVIVENHRPGFMDRRGLGWADVHKINPRLIYVSSSGYGSRGPYMQMGSTDTYGQAVSGFASITGAVGERPEAMRGSFPADIGSAQYIAAGVLAALYRRQATGIGEHIDTSQMQASCAMGGSRAIEYFATGEQPVPMGSGVGNIVPSRAYRAEDGRYVAVTATDETTWQRLCATLGFAQLAGDPTIQSNAGRVANRDTIDAAIEGAIATKPADHWIETLTAQGVPASGFLTHNQLRIHPQVRQHRMIEDVETPWGRITVGGMPWKFSRTPGEIRSSRRVGADNEELLREFEPSQMPPAPVEVAPPPTGARGPLEGLNVVDLTQGYIGYLGMLFADLGADVVKIEPPEGDYLRKLGGAFVGDTAAAFLGVNRSKQSVRLAWQSDATARAALGRLIARADVLISDLQPTAASQHGLTEEALRAAYPRLVFTSVTPFGDSGPLAEQPATDLEIQAISSQWRYHGVQGAAPVRNGVPMSAINAALYAFQGTLAAIHERTTSGLGQKVECSQLGAELTMQTIMFAAESEPDDWLGHCNIPQRPPARGFATRTQSILFGFGVFDDQEPMSAFCERLGLSDEFARTTAWNAEASHATFEEAFKNHDADEIIEWVRELRGQAVHYHTFETLLTDPQGQIMNVVQEYDYPGHGPLKTMGLAWDFELTPAAPGRPPLLGEHTEAVLTWAGLSPDEVARLAR